MNSSTPKVSTEQQKYSKPLLHGLTYEFNIFRPEQKIWHFTNILKCNIWKLLYFDKSLTYIWWQGSNQQQVRIGFDDGLVPSRSHAITWTNDYQDHNHYWLKPSLYELLHHDRFIFKADSRFAPSQWEMLLRSNGVSHWLGANLESAVIFKTKSRLQLLDYYLLWKHTFHHLDSKFLLLHLDI